MIGAETNRKLAAFGQVLVVVLAVVGPLAVGAITFSGAVAAAANEQPEVVRTVEYNGNIEITFSHGVVQNNTVNAGASSGTGDQLNENNFTVRVDGKTYGADGDFDVFYSSGTDPNGAGEDVTFTLVPQSSWGDLDPNRNVTVTIHGVQADTAGGPVTTPGTTDVTVTSQVVTAGGAHGAVVDAAPAYQGEIVALQGSPGEELEVKDFGGATQFRSNFGNSTVRTMNTSTYSTGSTYRVNFGSGDTQYVNVSAVDLSITTDDTTIDPSTDLEADVSVIRDGPATVRLRNATGDVVESRTLSLTGGDVTTINFRTQPPAGSPYTVTAVDNETNTSVSTAPITVKGDADFGVTVDGTNEPVTASETLSVDATVRNRNEYQSTGTVELRDASGTVLDTRSVTLAAGESRPITLSWQPNVADAGERTLTVAAPTDTASTDVTVRRPTFAVELDGTTGPVTAGETLAVFATVRNRGVQDTQRIELRDSDGTVLDRTNVTLGAGGATGVTLVWETDSEDASTTLTVASVRGSDSARVTIQDGAGSPPGAGRDPDAVSPTPTPTPSPTPSPTPTQSPTSTPEPPTPTATPAGPTATAPTSPTPRAGTGAPDRSPTASATATASDTSDPLLETPRDGEGTATRADPAGASDGPPIAIAATSLVTGVAIGAVAVRAREEW